MKRINHRIIFFVCMAVLSISNVVTAQSKATSLPSGTYRNIFDMLKEVPGLDVRSSNDKNGGSVTIRGIGSLSNQKNPLIVVNGSIYGGDLSGINPQDVEGISVLKDAASATAYGAQGAAGVILITTKKGGSVTNNAVVSSHTESAYTYFIEHKTPLKVFGVDDQVIMEGVIQKQVGTSLVFIKKRKEVLIAIKDILRVEMIRE
jgi:TonB-dependent SusC/RagA subfamily outer membrane receptor